VGASDTTTLYIKDMVCPRCVKVVRDELTRLGLDVRSVVLGEVVVGGNRDALPLERIREVLAENGFGFVEDRRGRTIEKIKHAALKLARNDHRKDPIRVKDSEFIAKEVGMEYHHLSTLFSEVESLTIEQYLILQKIEYVKELLKYDELTLSEISFLMGYSSVAHVSNQFRKVTGMTPSAFKAMGGPHRRPIDRVGRAG
jgi:AraC family transcriptional regulator